MGTIRTTIWGSCISRDTFGYLPEEYELLTYVARQSWLSVGHDAAESGLDFGAYDSPFQTRVIKGDVAGDAQQVVGSFRSKTDLLLLDLCDERLGVVRLPGGGIATRSVEKIANGTQEAIDAEGEVLEFGSDEHFALWEERARELHAWLVEKGLADKTLMLAPDWALFDDSGAPTPTSFGLPAVRANQLFERYYQAAADIGFHLLRLEGTLAGTEHVWGPAAFHFHDVTYERLTSEIGRFTEGSSTA